MMRNRGRDHDPEREAAAYLAGEQGRRERRRFERHLLECESCWEEVRSARVGRAIAERARELAPPELRERVRATVAMAEGGRRHRGLVPVLAGLIAVIVAGALMLPRVGEHPEPIAAALAAYHAESIPAEASPSRSAPDLGSAGLRLAGSGAAVLGGIRTDVFVFHDEWGGRLLLYVGDEAFPPAAGAWERTGAIHGWRATAEGVSLVCADRPISYLLMSESVEMIARAEVALQQSQVFVP